jgi:uncharacterized protein
VQDLTLWLETAVKRLETTLGCERVVLFGSFARGTQSRTSDIDLFIVWETPLPALERIGQVLMLLRDAPRPLEVVVYTPREFRERQHLPFLRTILREGKTLYESRTVTA